MVSYELKKLIQIPEVIKMLDKDHFIKFERYLEKALTRLVEDEVSNGANDSVASTTNQRNVIRFSTCFNDLALLRGINIGQEIVKEET